MSAKTTLVSIALLAAAASNSALAMDQGDWLIRFGLSNVDPKSNNHPAVSVDSAASATCAARLSTPSRRTSPA